MLSTWARSLEIAHGIDHRARSPQVFYAPKPLFNAHCGLSLDDRLRAFFLIERSASRLASSFAWIEGELAICVRAPGKRPGPYQFVPFEAPGLVPLSRLRKYAAVERLALSFDIADANGLTATSTFQNLAIRQRCGFQRDAVGNMAGEVVKITKGRARYD